MDRIRTLLAASVVSGLAVGSATAGLVIYEPFDYASTAGVNNGASLGDGGQTGGTGLGTWTQANSGSNEIDVAASGLTFTDGASNVLPVSGNAMERAVRVGQAAVNAPITATGFATEGTTTWMTFLYRDRGFSGPDFAIALTSETMNFGDAQALTTAGYGVGLGINSTGGQNRNIGTAVYNNATGQTFVPEASPTFNGPGSSGIRMLAVKVNWNAGSDDEIFVFDVSGDFSTEPAEGTALASDTFNFDQATQNLLDNLAINESQVSDVDEIRIGDTWGSVIPEPSSLALLGLGGLFVARRRRA